MDVLNQLFSTFKVAANIFHNGQYCGDWAINTSGTHYMNFHIVSHGTCYLSVPSDTDAKDKPIALSQGDVVIFPRDSQHIISKEPRPLAATNSALSQDYTHGVQPSATGLVCGYFSHNHPLVNSITVHLPGAIIIKSHPLNDKSTGLHFLLSALLDESKQANKGSTLIMGRIAEAILAIIFRQHLPTDNGVLAATGHPKLGPVMSAIHAQPNKKWTVEMLAEQCFMSRAGFNDLFKSVVQQAPMEYVTQWRLGLAYSMLADENVSTLHAALACGYDNESSFSKAFKRVLGVSPGAVRAKKEQKV
ncbi:RCS-specific HTH-type transcriptional activator RclR [Paraglaciecola mesophila]|uniref:RCS-specific HTH-type transcriptional activator RclR n=1 Tax=Paraglaciecola mesophila TaxID=197222 RepID=A0A857JFJ9_9ALTE|nr:AraC family transcriptional regulator [Paraglaciecola mesophila]QHJ09958.1 RCS-specific HTH-type transcriptional activator RclR [Paraglaciecola mesophila]